LIATAEDRFAIVDRAALYMRELDRLDGALREAQYWPEARCEDGVFSARARDQAARIPAVRT
jgi:hypothetical protein